MSTTRKLIVVSLSIGVVASLLSTLGLMFFYGPYGGLRTGAAMLISVSMMLTWVTRCVFVLIQHRKKGLCFLVGLPFGVLWPLCVFAIWWPCAAHWSCF